MFEYKPMRLETKKCRPARAHHSVALDEEIFDDWELDWWRNKGKQRSRVTVNSCIDWLTHVCPSWKFALEFAYPRWTATVEMDIVVNGSRVISRYSRKSGLAVASLVRDIMLMLDRKTLIPSHRYKSRTLGARIRTARIALGMKSHEFAEALGVAQSQVSKWESDIRVPSKITFWAIVELLKPILKKSARPYLVDGVNDYIVHEMAINRAAEDNLKYTFNRPPATKMEIVRRNWRTMRASILENQDDKKITDADDAEEPEVLLEPEDFQEPDVTENLNNDDDDDEDGIEFEKADDEDDEDDEDNEDGEDFEER